MLFFRVMEMHKKLLPSDLETARFPWCFRYARMVAVPGRHNPCRRPGTLQIRSREITTSWEPCGLPVLSLSVVHMDWPVGGRRHELSTSFGPTKKI